MMSTHQRCNVNGTREEINKEDAGIAVNALMASAINDPMWT